MPGDRAELGPSQRERKRFGVLAAAQHLTVSQASELIKTTLEQRLPSPLRVVGEISNLSAKNHWYFSLKDEASVLSCVSWATAVKKFGFTPKDGDQVLATGHVSHYGPQGRTQMYVSDLAPIGAGALEMRFRALCDELRKLGYFDESRKKPLPVFPRRIAIITSASGAALQDVIYTAAHRCKAIALLVVDVRVQGEGAAEKVAHAIRWVDRNRRKLAVDAILVTRGGGSIEDLWAFNERIVADAVFKCSLPVVAAIGHESDTTIIELVADVRGSTPTQAAMRLIPSAPELCKQVEHLAHRLGFMVHRAMERQRQQLHRLFGELRHLAVMTIARERSKLERLTLQLTKRQPRAQLARRQARLAVATDRLHRAIVRRVDAREHLRRLGDGLHRSIGRHVNRLRHRTTSLERELAAIDPYGVLRRGYSLTMHRNGTLIRSVEDVHRAEQIVTRVVDGSIESVVGGLELRTNGQRPPRRKERPTEAGQMDLFGGPQ